MFGFLSFLLGVSVSLWFEVLPRPVAAPERMWRAIACAASFALPASSARRWPGARRFPRRGDGSRCGRVLLPGHVAEGPEQDLQTTDFLSEKSVAAGVGDQVVQSAIDDAGLLDEARRRARRLSRIAGGILRQRVQLGQVDAAAGPARGRALEDAADLVDLADFAGRDAADDGPAIGRQVDDADAGQRDECLADRRVADAEAIGQLLRDQVLPGPQPTVEDVGQQRLHDRLPAQTMIAFQASCERQQGSDWEQAASQVFTRAGEPRDRPPGVWWSSGQAWILKGLPGRCQEILQKGG